MSPARPPTPLETWLERSQADAERRGLPALAPMLEGLARATATLRAAAWNLDLAGTVRPEAGPVPPVDPNAR